MPACEPQRHFARVVKGVDLKSTAERRVGSNPAGDDIFVLSRRNTGYRWLQLCAKVSP